jgi:hypothetical protein
MAYLGRAAILIAGGFLIFVIGEGLGLRVRGIPVHPQADITPLEVDLGVVQVHQRIERSFVLRNVGNAKLLIKEVKTSCQCTIPRVPSLSLAPRTSESVGVVFTADSVGPKVQRVIFETNDPRTPIQVFTVRADAVALKSR